MSKGPAHPGRRGTTFPLRTPDLDPRRLRAWLRSVLEEDRAGWDVTSQAVIPAGLQAVGVVEAQGAGVLSGLGASVLLAHEAHLHAAPLRQDGDQIVAGQPVLLLAGRARDLLAAERSLLNLLMHLSGVATATASAVRAGHRGSPRLVVAATRKTLPGLRDLEKAAVVHGGGDPHRRDLSDAVLIKTNHLSLVPMEEAIRRARSRRHASAAPLIVEVRDLEEARAAARAGAGRLLLDNLSPQKVRRLVRGLQAVGLRRRVVIEVSGGITAANVAAYARSGADVASLGSLTHSARSLPFHLVIHPSPPPPAGPP